MKQETKVLVGGPFAGEKLHHLPTGNTFEFTAKGQTGYYSEAGVWQTTCSLARSLGYPVQCEKIGLSIVGGTDCTTTGAIGQP